VESYSPILLIINHKVEIAGFSRSVLAERKCSTLVRHGLQLWQPHDFQMEFHFVFATK
jgi:hypothetical protein